MTSKRIGSDTIAFASILSGAYASAAVALFFLVVDTARGEPLLTPSVMGSVVLLGQAPSADLPIRLDLLAYYSLIHFVIFVLLGTAATLSYVKLAAHRPRPVVLGAGILAVLMAGELVVDSFWMPGLVAALGPLFVGLANLAASIVMAVFIHRTIAGQSAEVVDHAAVRPVA